MSLNDLANIGQVIGAIAVVVSLIYVALQIRQNTAAIRSATAQSVHEHFANWYQQFATDESLSEVAVKGLKDYGALSETQKARFVSIFMAFLSYGQNAFLKWRQGLLSQSLWIGWEQVLMNLLGASGGKSLWKERAYLFGEEFRRHVEGDLMKRTPHPDAKPLGAFPIGKPSA